MPTELTGLFIQKHGTPPSVNEFAEDWKNFPPKRYGLFCLSPYGLASAWDAAYSSQQAILEMTLGENFNYPQLITTLLSLSGRGKNEIRDNIGRFLK